MNDTTTVPVATTRTQHAAWRVNAALAELDDELHAVRDFVLSGFDVDHAVAVTAARLDAAVEQIERAVAFSEEVPRG